MDVGNQDFSPLDISYQNLKIEGYTCVF